MNCHRLGKTHRVQIFQFETRIIHMVSLTAGLLIGSLVYIWLQPMAWWACALAGLLLAFTVARVSEVPFCKEVLTTPLKGRVSFDP